MQSDVTCDGWRGACAWYDRGAGGSGCSGMYAEFSITHAMIWNLRFINMCLLGIYIQATDIFTYVRARTDVHANINTYKRHTNSLYNTHT